MAKRDMRSTKPAGTVMTIEFELNGQAFTALNGGPVFKFNEAIPFQVSCKSQEEVDYYWEKLSEGGDEKAQQCGWLKDKYGVSWQIVPAVLGEMLQDNDAEVSNQVMKALLQMKKLDIKKLKQAYATTIILPMSSKEHERGREMKKNKVVFFEIPASNFKKG